MLPTQLGFSDRIGQMAVSQGGGPAFLGRPPAAPGESVDPVLETRRRLDPHPSLEICYHREVV